ncbi:branched-chain amino acid ABC transporter permease [Shinella daejeonensis]|uniref:branched-chain amino acid ABC transporter permease n=1 Tax=Shinella daejeonensis TaxID=659017 RepID=UPI0020C797F9|nr:branched-chain amino acid ABC transporter permease [Shinella daejeonensis]MCP8894742.1 branched-chain amino acid ABC transporter permease [Shinella daejeonensis]
MQNIVNVLSLTSFYVSFSLGLAMVFGILRIVNYAHGEVYMIGGYSLWLAVSLLNGIVPGPVIMLAALFLSAAVGAVLGIVLQGVVFTPLRDKAFSIFMATLGVSYILQSLVVLTVGASGRSISPLFPGFSRFSGAIFPNQRIFVFCMTLLLVGTLYVFLMRTSYGRKIRAVAQNPRGAMLQGISLRQVNLWTAIIGAVLASVAGALMASVVSINPYMGTDAIWRAFIIIIVGGIGSIPGAIIAAVIFATTDTMMLLFGFGKLNALVDALVMLGVLAIRPQGLLGVKE